MKDDARDYALVFASTADDALVGARWWNEAFDASDTMNRRNFGTLITLALALGAGAALGAAESCGDDDDGGISMDALDLQRREGWNVGQSTSILSLANPAANDVDGGQAWESHMGSLAQVLAPESAQLQPYYVPTLFQVLAQPGSETLAKTLRPMYRASMSTAFSRAGALAALVAEAGTPPGLAVILDVPGPESVAMAAALVEVMAPVFTFDNWPHPKGVVPAHETLAALLYYLPRFLGSASTRPANAPPVFVLDAGRLAPYRDD